MVYNNFGLLSIRAFAAEEALPIEDVNVRIIGADEYNQDVYFSLLTDEDGLTPAVSLPAPDIKYSLSPTPVEIPYARYDVEIYKEGYYSKKISDVVIFSGVNTTLPVNMIPFIAYNDGGRYPRGNVNARVYENSNLE